MPWIGGTDAKLSGKLAAAIGIERRHLILLDIRRPLSPVEHIVGRNMNERNPVTPGLGRKSCGRLSVNGKRRRLFTFSAIDVGICGSIDDGAPRRRCNNPCDRRGVLQIDFTVSW